jgi:hypothetical protein
MLQSQGYYTCPQSQGACPVKPIIKGKSRVTSSRPNPDRGRAWIKKFFTTDAFEHI